MAQKGAEGIYFNDDEMFGNPKNARAILDHLALLQNSGKIPASLRFYGQTRVDKVDPPTLALMKQIGFTFLSFGVESFSDASLAAVDLKKGFRAQQAIDSVRAAFQAGIPITNVNLILFHPTITLPALIATIEHTIALLREAIAHEVRFSINAFPLIEAYAGAPINDLAKKHGWPTTSASLQHNGNQWEYIVSYLPLDPVLRGIVSDESVAGEPWMHRFDAIMDRLTKDPRWPTLPISRSIGINGLVMFMSIYELLHRHLAQLEHSPITSPAEMEELIWTLVAQYNPSIESTANHLMRAQGNVHMGLDPHSQQPLFRMGNMEVLDLPREVLQRLWQSQQSELLMRFPPEISPLTLKKALQRCIYQGESLQQALTEIGVPCFGRSEISRVLLVHPLGQYDGAPLKTAVPHPGIERIHFQLLRSSPRVDSLVFNPNLTPLPLPQYLRGLSGIDVIGFSYIPVTLQNDARIIDALASAYPNTLILGGGLNIDRLPFDQFWQHTPFDLFVSGSGETLLPKLLSLLPPHWQDQPKAETLKHIAELSQRTPELARHLYVRNHHPINDGRKTRASNCTEPAAEDVLIDEQQLCAGIPYDRADVVHGCTYLQQIDTIHGGVQPNDMIGSRRLYVKMSDNCKARCIFCSAPFVKTTPEPIARLITQIQENAHRFDSVHFADNDLLYDRALALQLCAALVEAGLDQIPKVGKSRTDEVDPELLTALRRAGFRMITFGVESFSDRILKAMWKKNTAQNNRTALAATLAAGITPGMDMIFFSPWETRESLVDSLVQALGFVEQGAYLNLVPELHVHPGDHVHRSHYPVETVEISFPSSNLQFSHPKRAFVAKKSPDGSWAIDHELETLRQRILDRQRAWMASVTAHGLVHRSDFPSESLWESLIHQRILEKIHSNWALIRQPLPDAIDFSVQPRRYISFSLASLIFASSTFHQVEDHINLARVSNLIEKTLDQERK